MTTDANTSSVTALLKLAVDKGIITADQAGEANQESQRTMVSPTAVLVARGLLTPNLVANLRTEVERAQGPKFIGGHRVVGMLGRGGMGVVYKAMQKGFDREIALKVMDEHLARNPMFADRFLREAQTSARVNHSNVVTVFDTGRDRDQLYLAMELVTGGDADQLRVKHGGRLPPRRAVEVIRDAAQGLDAVHAAGLVHRDIKPSNLFITAKGMAKLADLGLSRQESGDDRLTMSGEILGTPAFMSPEQASGDHIDIRTDIYALGATLFVLVTGQSPYTGTTAMAIAVKAVNGPFPDPHQYLPTLPVVVADVIRKSTRKKAAERQQTPAELVADLEGALRDSTLAEPAPMTIHPIVGPMPHLPDVPTGTGRVPVMEHEAATGGSATPVTVGQRQALAQTFAQTGGGVTPVAIGEAPTIARTGGGVTPVIVQEPTAIPAVEIVAPAPETSPQTSALKLLQKVIAAVAFLTVFVTAVWLWGSLGPVAVSPVSTQTPMPMVPTRVSPTPKSDLPPAAVAPQKAIARPDISEIQVGVKSLDAEVDRANAKLATYDHDAKDQSASADQRAFAGHEYDAWAQYLDWLQTAVQGHPARAHLTNALNSVDANDTPHAEAELTQAKAALAAWPAQRGAEQAKEFDAAVWTMVEQDWRRGKIGILDQYLQHDVSVGLADLRHRLAVLDQPGYVTAEQQTTLNLYITLAGANDPQAQTWQAKAKGQADLVTWLTAHLDAAQPALSAADLPTANDKLDTLEKAVGSTQFPSHDAWRARVDTDQKSLADLKQRLAALDQQHAPYAGATTDLAAYRQRVSTDDADFARWTATLTDIQQAMDAFKGLDTTHKPAILVAAIRAAADKLEKHIGTDPQVTAARAVADHWATVEASAAAMDEDRKALAVLDQVHLPTDVDRRRLQAFTAAAGDQDPDGVRWRARIASIDRLSAATARLDSTGPLPIADRDAAAQELTDLKTLIGASPDGTRRQAVVDSSRTLEKNLTTALGALDNGPAPVDRLNDLQSNLDRWKAAFGADEFWQRWSKRIAAALPASLWASATGRDAMGFWADLTVSGATQRLRFIPAGSFFMGSPGSESGHDSDEQQHRVTLSQGFWLADSECTQALWQAVMGANPSRGKKDPSRPVDSVSWDMCGDFTTKLNAAIHGGTARLPTEAEWEYACRAGTADAYAGAILDTRGWYGSNSNGESQPVKQKSSNAWGLYDMLGNVAEWTSDVHDDFTDGAATDPTGPSEGSSRVNRGGAFDSDAEFCRAATRGNTSHARQRADIGLRIALSASP